MTDADNQVFLLLGRLEGKVDQFLSKQQNHDDRITALEEGKNTAKGAMITVSAVASTIIGFGTALFTHWILK